MTREFLNSGFYTVLSNVDSSGGEKGINGTVRVNCLIGKIFFAI